ncbi:hypothetical protein L1785_13770 [Antribacter sp. KLBMP9083]|uniref:Uncharacterized protein n=1 Tax=Antribacter soli TaxID=2910976 RepID=A0AA41QG58_9MICO|nr:hypothetical protein [Antribacter soli]MCF4122046.1 hypothetical protein [Antribacter soli]
MRKDERTLEEKIADRNAKLDALHEKLATAVGQLVTGEDCCGRLHLLRRSGPDPSTTRS